MFINRNFNNIFDKLVKKEYNYSKKVMCINPLTLQILWIFNSANEAGIVLKLDDNCITSVCRKETESCGGYYFNYLDEYFKEISGQYLYCKAYPQSNELFNNKFTFDIFDFIVYNNLSNYISPCFALLSGEILKDIPNYEGLYQASNYGRIISLWNYPYIKELKPGLDKNNYYNVCLYDNNRNQKTYNIHKLIANTFIPNPLNLPCINHINEIKTDNKVVNLERCTVEYNNNYGSRNKKIAKSLYKTVQQIDLNNNEVINEFNSIKEINEITNINIGNISQVCCGKRISAGGFGWKFK